MSDPMTDIENEKAQHDAGTSAYWIYRGARDAGANRRDAIDVVIAWWLAAFRHGMDPL